MKVISASKFFFNSPTDAQMNRLKTILKFTLKLTLKQPIKIHRCVVIWLHMLVGPCWCVWVALFGSRLVHLLVNEDNTLIISRCTVCMWKFSAIVR